MANGIRFVVIGLAVGVALAAAATRLLSTMLFGVGATDPATFAQVAVVVGALSVLACAIPMAGIGKSVESVLKAE